MILFKEFVLRLSKAKNLSSSLVNIFFINKLEKRE